MSDDSGRSTAPRGDGYVLLDGAWASPASVARLARATAHHEAAHAVAAVSDGHDLIFTRLHPDDPGTGLTRYAPTHLDRPGYSTYAGPWADERLDLAGDPERLGTAEPGGSAGWDARESLIDLPRDSIDLARLTSLGWPDDPALIRAMQEWDADLERLWPVIQRVAARMVDGETVTHEVVEALLEEHGPGAKPRSEMVPLTEGPITGGDET